MSSLTRISNIFLNDVQVFNPSVGLDDVKTFVLTSEAYLRFKEFTSYQFKNNDLFFTSLVHRSFAHEVRFKCEHNEKLEFLGDSVLQLLVSEKLYKLYPDLKEGKLSKLRSSIVNENSLAELALSIKLDELILLGKGEYKEEGYLKPSLLANLFEAIMGAMYLDSNLEVVRSFLEKVTNSFKEKTSRDLFSLELVSDFDAKSKLQEICLKEFKTLPLYEAVDIKKDNIQAFEITLKIKNQKIASLVDISKKKGMQKLAKMVLDKKLYKEIKE